MSSKKLKRSTRKTGSKTLTTATTVPRRRAFLRCLSTFTKSGGNFIVSRGSNKWTYKFERNYSISCNEPWSILFFGTDEFALYSLQALFNEYKQKRLLQRLEIVTNYKGQENSLIAYATENNIAVHSWPPQIKDNEFDIGVVVSFGHLIPSKMIKLFPLGMINVHGSLLPRWRGAAPICHALMNGDTVTGVSIMKIMPKKFDIGSVIAKKEVVIKPDETYIDLYNKLGKLGSIVLVESMYSLPSILNTATPQTEEQVTYAPKITQKNSFINWKEMSAQDVYNLQRALLGIHPLRAYLDNQIIKLLDIKCVDDPTSVHCTQEKFPGLAIFDKRKRALYISCQGNSWISVKTVIIPGRKPLSAVNFSSGFIQNRKEKFCIFS
ncbi:methionyl-tRNA formyltransferase, mitochondrial isoform X2 [Phymastichus coffea]|uniref:methionyl-tRNA formyltransferase, mitochondrial isoform X2 n=1 Tax=Phymastichus coffea TaxID=108790 RepID=UPI00273A9EBB|nr:methionyl-tRNA formyltransferase, mitochondrial isoform X2 [Phymastichus coffea]